MEIAKLAAELAHNSDNLWFGKWVRNSYINYPLIEKHMDGHWHIVDVPILLRYENKHKGVPAVVLGSGPSLDDNVEYLKTFKGIIFCGPTQIQALKRMGIDADYLVPVDANSQINRFTQITELEYPKTTLLATPIMDHQFLKDWQWERAYYLPETGGTKTQMEDEVLTLGELWEKYRPHKDESSKVFFKSRMQVFIKQVLHEAYLTNPKMAPGLNPSIRNSGNTPAQCISIANYLGCEPIFMLGCDCCFNGEKTRAITWQYERSTNSFYKWNRNFIYEARNSVEYNGKLTTESMVIDIRSFILCSIYENMQVVEVGDGAIDYFPKITPEEFGQNIDCKHLYKTKEVRQKEAGEWIKENTGAELILVEGKNERILV